MRPTKLRSVTVKLVTDHGNMYVTVSYKVRGKPFEVFVQVERASKVRSCERAGCEWSVKEGSCEGAWIEALTRAITTGLRHGVPASAFIEQLRGITCTPISNGSEFIRSPADGLAKVLQEFVDEGKRAEA